MNNINHTYNHFKPTSNLNTASLKNNYSNHFANSNSPICEQKSLQDLRKEELQMFIKYLIAEIKLHGGSVSIGNSPILSPDPDVQDLYQRAKLANLLAK